MKHKCLICQASQLRAVDAFLLGLMAGSESTPIENDVCDTHRNMLIKHQMMVLERLRDRLYTDGPDAF